MRKAIIGFLLLISQVCLAGEYNKPKKMGGYDLLYNTRFPLVYFRKGKVNYASYNLKDRFWYNKNKTFNDNGIDLTLFYKTSENHKKLDRMMPSENLVQSGVKNENANFNYSKVEDFKKFLKYLDKKHTHPKRIKFYKKAASNPGKRGRRYIYSNKLLSEMEVGIQAENLRSVNDKNKKWSAGGMQYYFDVASGEYTRSVNTAVNIFKKNNIVPVTIFEIEPKGKVSTGTILRGAELVSRVKKDLESTLNKNFDVESKVISISYEGFLNTGKVSPLYHYGRYLRDHKDISIAKDRLHIYYFVDNTKFNLTPHPLRYGPYGTDWNRNWQTFIHELGHSLGMRHHFNNRKGSRDITTHISPSCIMNYKFKSERFCELCSYALGI